MRERRLKQDTPTPTPIERGLNLDVAGAALIAQAEERIKWHKQTAAVMAAELKTLPRAGTNADLKHWEQHSRRTDLESRMSGHLEYAKFLTFVRENIVRDRRYRIGVSDMTMLEIMPKRDYR